jgi:hypothetical protein
MPFIDGTPFSNLDINKGRHYTFSWKLIWLSCGICGY